MFALGSFTSLLTHDTVGYTGVIIYLGQGGLHSLSASSNLVIIVIIIIISSSSSSSSSGIVVVVVVVVIVIIVVIIIIIIIIIMKNDTLLSPRPITLYLSITSLSNLELLPCDYTANNDDVLVTQGYSNDRGRFTHIRSKSGELGIPVFFRAPKAWWSDLQAWRPLDRSDSIALAFLQQWHWPLCGCTWHTETLAVEQDQWWAHRHYSLIMFNVIQPRFKKANNTTCFL